MYLTARKKFWTVLRELSGRFQLVSNAQIRTCDDQLCPIIAVCKSLAPRPTKPLAWNDNFNNQADTFAVELLGMDRKYAQAIVRAADREFTGDCKYNQQLRTMRHRLFLATGIRTWQQLCPLSQ